MSNQLMNRKPLQPRLLPAKQPTVAPAPVPRNPAVDEIIQMASRLIAIMEQETALLARMQIAVIAAGQVEKDRLARNFETKLRALSADKNVSATVAPALRAELQAVMDKFRVAMSANERSLRAAREANERVVKAIVDAAQAQSAPRHAYSATGTIGGSTGSDRIAPAPVTLDRRL